MGKYRPVKKPFSLKELNQKIEAGREKKIREQIDKIEKKDLDDLEQMKIERDIEINYKAMQDIFGGCSDFIMRRFSIIPEKTDCFLAYIEGMVDRKDVNEDILKPLMVDRRIALKEEEVSEDTLAETLKSASITTNAVKDVKTLRDAVKFIVESNCVIFINGSQNALAIDLKGWKAREVSEPNVEPGTRSPKEAFVEDVRINTTLIRRRIKTPNLKSEKFEIGRISKTTVYVFYIKGLAQEGILNEIKERLGRIDIDIAIESGQIEPFLEDSPLSPFPQMDITERVDGSVMHLANGKFVILVDGTPFVIIIPTVFSEFLNTSEDNYTRIYFATYIRVLRYIAFFTALLGPSIYIAVTTFHQEMIPTSLLISLATSRVDVPFPAFFEALMLEITWEVLREAGERLPRFLGQSLNIVGALVIGQAAAQAGIVSQPMLIVVSFTGIASLTIPKFNMSRTIRMLRFPIMVFAAALGVFGIIMCIMVLLIHMASIRSFGVPYISPVAPINIDGIKTLVIKFPLWLQTRRPSFIQKDNITKEKSGLMPKPPRQGD